MCNALPRSRLSYSISCCEVMAVATSPSAHDASIYTKRSVIGIVSIIVGNIALVVVSMTLRGSGETTTQALMVFAGLSATAGLVWTILRVHERHQRRAAFFLLAGVFCLLANSFVRQTFATVAITVLAIVLVFISLSISIRALRARPE